MSIKLKICKDIDVFLYLGIVLSYGNWKFLLAKKISIQGNILPPLIAKIGV